MSPHRRWISALGALAVVGAGVVLVWSAISTSSARVTATTTSESFFEAGEVSLTQPGDAVELLFDADGLYPGTTVEGCIEIAYTGNIAASVRLHAESVGGTGLEAFVDLGLEVTDGQTCETDGGELTPTVIFDGRLQGLWDRHPNFDAGVVVRDSTRPEDIFTLRATASVTEDNRAQGLTTEFVITIEARP